MVNLLNFYHLFKTSSQILEDKNIQHYLEIQDVKEHEKKDLFYFCQNILQTTQKSFEILNNFYINYKIPQIGKEFDLLKFGKDRVINIELKSQEVDPNKLLKQMERNYYYLHSLQKTIACYVFTAWNNKILKFVPQEKVLENTEAINIVKFLENMDPETKHPDQLFVPTKYLVSPFNDTNKFLNNQYFLTQQQEDICLKILQQIKKEGKGIFSISGQAGTGKTLLTYHIAKKLKQNFKTLIVHCAQFNNGIQELKNEKWNIECIKNLLGILEKDSDIIIIDESQRLTMMQLQKILQTKNKKILIFSHDVHQKLNSKNQAEEVVATIKKQAIQDHNLNHKIRYNQEIAYFIKKVFDPNNKSDKNIRPKNFPNITLYYVNNNEDAEKYIDYLKEKDWQHIYLSPSLINVDPLNLVKFSSNTSSHGAIGQEWDNIVTTITKDFYYKENGKLGYKIKSYYNPLETLFQALTRARKRLCLIFINNIEVYTKCVEAINPH